MSLDVVRVLVQHGQIDPMRLSSSKQLYTNLHAYTGPSTVFKWLIQQEYFQIDFEEHSKEGESILLHQIGYRLHWGESLARIQVLLDSGCDVNWISSTSQYRGYTALHSAVRRLPIDIRNLRAQKCESVIRALLVAGSDIHTRTSNGQTPLDVLVEWSLFSDGFHGDEKQFKTEAIDRWLKILRSLGLDLKQYGLREEEIHQFKNTRVAYVFGGRLDWDFTLDFKYGDCSKVIFIAVHSNTLSFSKVWREERRNANFSWLELHTRESSESEVNLLQKSMWSTSIILVIVLLISCLFSGLRILERTLVKPFRRSVLDSKVKSRENLNSNELRVPGSWIS
jgi:hypothetical protein